MKNRNFLVLILSLSLMACSPPETTDVVAEPVRAIKYQVVGDSETRASRKLSGHIQARESSQLGFQVSGQVMAVHVDVGDRIERGDLIAELDSKPYEYKLRTVEAELSGAKSSLYEREENYNKQQRVFKKSYISKSDLDRAKSEYEKAQSAVRLAQSHVELASRDLENTRLLAPFAGTINRRDIEPFEDVSVAVSVFEIQGTAGFEVVLLLPSRMLSAVDRGAEVAVELPALGLSDLQGVVSERGLRADSRGAYPLTVMLTTAAPRVQAGMAAEVIFPINSDTEVFLLPNSAFIVESDGSHLVNRFDPALSIVKRVPVKTRLWSLDTLAVEEGLSKGDIVGVAGVEFLRDGQQVRLYEPKL